MSQLRTCRSCLETDGKLFSLSDKELVQILDEFTGIPTSGRDGLPLYICVVCIHLIKKFRMFKQKCYRASFKLQQLQTCGQLTMKNIKHLNKKDYGNNIKSTSPEINSYTPPLKAFNTTTYHMDLTSKIFTKIVDVAHTVDSNEYNPDNYFDSVVEDVPIKKEISNEEEIHNNSSSTNVKLYDFNHDDSINNYKYEMEFSNNDNNTEDNVEVNEYDIDFEIKEETLEQTAETEVGNNKIKKNNPITENMLQDEVKSEVKKNTRKRCIGHRELKNKRKEEEMEEDLEEEVLEEGDEEFDQTRKNATQLYYNHPDKQISKLKIQKRLRILDNFAKAYNVEVKFLTKEEQAMELEQRKTFYKDLPYTCEFCFRGYSILDTYTSHMVVHHPSSGDFECHVCKIRCKTSRDREKHINATHLKRFTCKQCGVVTKSQSYARAHFARHEGASFSCDQCGKKFTQQTNYFSHMRSAHGDRACVCPLCYDTFLGPVGLRVHIGVVHKQAVRCSSCKTQFDNETALSKHLESVADEVCEPGVRSCPMCGLNFKTEELVKKHYEGLHKTEMKCNTCNKVFPTKFRLSTHMQEHKKHGKLPNAGRFICESCGKDFRNLNQLRYHQRVHTGERPYKCKLCAKTFRLSHLLQCHMYVHTDERRYKCPMCPKAFRQPAHRTAHLLTHTKERPYACAACPKQYSSASAAKEHADTVHRGLPARRRDKHRDT